MLVPNLTQPSAIITATGFTAVGGGEYVGWLESFDDYANTEYYPSNVAVGDGVIDAKAEVYRVTQIITATGGSVRVKVLALEALKSSPVGRGGAFRPFADGYLPSLPVNTGQITPYLAARIELHNIALLADLPVGTGGRPTVTVLTTIADTTGIPNPQSGDIAVQEDGTAAAFYTGTAWVVLTGGGNTYNDQELRDLISGNTDRIAVLEQQGGSGYDDTELRGLIQGNTDANTVQDGRLDALEAAPGYDDTEVRGLISGNTTNISTLRTDVDSNDAELAQARTELDDHEVRIDALENAGGSGYNDTEVRQLIAGVRTDTDANTADNTAQDTLLADHENRIDALEAAGPGTGTGGGSGQSLIWASAMGLSPGTDQWTLAKEGTEVSLGYAATLTRINLVCSENLTAAASVELYVNGAATGVTVGGSTGRTFAATANLAIAADSELSFRTISGTGGGMCTVSITLGSAGGTGGGSYDDTALAGRVTQNEEDIATLFASAGSSSARQVVEVLDFTGTEVLVPGLTDSAIELDVIRNGLELFTTQYTRPSGGGKIVPQAAANQDSFRIKFRLPA